MFDLLPNEVAKSIPKLYEQEKMGDEAIVHVKFFDPCSQWTWYAAEFDGKDRFFGLVRGNEVELGYFSLKELQEYRGPMRIGIERDLWFKPSSLREVRRQLNLL